MIEKVEVGKYYRLCNKRSVHSDDERAPMQDGIPRKCIMIDKSFGDSANFEGIPPPKGEGNTWIWVLVDMEEVSGMEKMRKIKEELMGNGI